MKRRHATRRLLCLLCLCFALGCTKQTPQTVDSVEVPMPPQIANESNPTRLKENSLPDSPLSTSTTQKPQTLSATEESPSGAVGTTITMKVTPSASGPARRNEPQELASLLEMRASFGPDDTAVRQLRPSAIREAAQLVAIQSAISWRYAQLMAATEKYATIMDSAFNFSPLLMTQGDAMIMPPILTRGGAAMRIENPEAATASKASYELLEPAKYVSVPPHWRGYLMADGFPQPEKPNPSLLPKNSKERLIWREAIREAWASGIEQADELYLDNISRMVRDFRGVMLYHLLTAQHLLSQVRTASADLGIRKNENKLYLGQRVYRITEPSMFKIPAPEKGEKTVLQSFSKKKNIKRK